MRRLEPGIPALAFVGLLFWVLLLRPAFIQPPLQWFRTFLERFFG